LISGIIKAVQEYIPTIGLEVHAELNTRTKMFCDSLNDPDERHPNVNVCPVCLGHPGTLPVPNRQAIEAVIKVGLALGGNINPETKFDRKNYFYPDLPKGYQISQYDKPLVGGGNLNGVRLTRIHLEEDTGTLTHGEGEDTSLVDFNRAGVPLMELVTEPDMKSSAEAVAFGKELQLILRYLGVSAADMEKGQMRLEANISVSKDGKRGTKVEIKNINSFKALGAAIDFEIKRQKEHLEKGQKIVQETRGWDDVKQKTVSQRSKEEAHDYRYFPEPDIPPFKTAVFDIEELKRHLPELPQMKRKRFMSEYGLDATQTEILVAEPPLAEYFEEAVSELKAAGPFAPKTLLNYLLSDLKGLLNEKLIEFKDLKISPEHFAHLIALIEKGRIQSRQAKDILKKMFATGEDPESLLAQEGETVSDEGELEKVVLEIIAANPAAVEDYRKGKRSSLQFLLGQAMGKLRGRGNPAVLTDLFTKRLSS